MNFKIARHQLVVLAFAVISPVVISHAASQSSLGAVANTDRVAWAQSFLRAIYPDLNGKNLVATIETYVQYDKPGKPIDYWQLDVGEGTKDVPLGYSAGCLGHIIRPGDPPEKPLPSPGGREKLPLAELSPLIGKLRLISLSFEPLAKNRQTDESWPQWKAKVETISHGHQKLTYEMTFDRFNGDLISMNRLDLH